MSARDLGARTLEGREGGREGGQPRPRPLSAYKAGEPALDIQRFLGDTRRNSWSIPTSGFSLQLGRWGFATARAPSRTFSSQILADPAPSR